MADNLVTELAEVEDAASALPAVLTWLKILTAPEVHFQLSFLLGMLHTSHGMRSRLMLPSLV